MFFCFLCLKKNSRRLGRLGRWFCWADYISELARVEKGFAGSATVHRSSSEGHFKTFSNTSWLRHREVQLCERNPVLVVISQSCEQSSSQSRALKCVVCDNSWRNLFTIFNGRKDFVVTDWQVVYYQVFVMVIAYDFI